MTPLIFFKYAFILFKITLVFKYVFMLFEIRANINIYKPDLSISNHKPCQEELVIKNEESGDLSSACLATGTSCTDRLEEEEVVLVEGSWHASVERLQCTGPVVLMVAARSVASVPELEAELFAARANERFVLANQAHLVLVMGGVQNFGVPGHAEYTYVRKRTSPPHARQARSIF